MDDDDIEDTVVDYYAILHLNKTDDEDLIRDSYKKLSKEYHPDKHTDPKHKVIAERLFKKIQEAYQILSDEDNRRIYDIFGQKGLETGLEVVPRKRTAEEIKAEYDRTCREEEERQILQKTNPQGCFSLSVDASDFFDEQYLEYKKNSIYPNITIKGMLMEQSIEVPLTRDNKMTINGSLQSNNGLATGNLRCTVNHIHSTNLYGDFKFQIGSLQNIGISVHKTLNYRTSVISSLSLRAADWKTGLNATIMRQLSKNISGHIVFQNGSLNTRLINSTENRRLMGQLRISNSGRCLFLLSLGQDLGDFTKLNLSAKMGTQGETMLEYGLDHRISSLSRMGVAVTMGTASGVTLKLSLHRHQQSFVLPILLSEYMSPQAIFYGTVVPILLFWSAKAIFIDPVVRKEQERSNEETCERNADEIRQKRKEAEEEQLLMQTNYDNIILKEKNNPEQELVIVEAFYGKLLSEESPSKGIPQPFIDVRIPLQYLIERKQVGDRSTPQLILTGVSKAHLNGFCDPCPGERKQLKVMYTVGGRIHKSVFEDTDRVCIPNKSHLMVQI